MKLAPGSVVGVGQHICMFVRTNTRARTRTHERGMSSAVLTLQWLANSTSPLVQQEPVQSASKVAPRVHSRARTHHCHDQDPHPKAKPFRCWNGGGILGYWRLLRLVNLRTTYTFILRSHIFFPNSVWASRN